MPHECTTCGRTFPDGSKEMLSGCPDCGGNKFQFHPSGKPAPGGETPDSSGTARTPDSSGTARSGVGASDPSRDEPDRSPGSSSSPSSESSFSFGTSRSSSDARSTGSEAEHGTDSAPEPAAGTSETIAEESDTIEEDPDTPREDRAQASARRSFVSEDELPRDDAGAGTDPGTPANVESPPPDSPTDVDEDPAPDVEAEPAEEPEPADLGELREELNDQFESIKIHARGEYELNLMELYDREEHIIALQEDGRYVIDVPGSWRDADEDD